MTEWFEQWFGEEYHALYPHRDEMDARRAVALVWRVAQWRDGDRVLDLACGAGRHAAELERLGARVVGFDLSLAMLRRARGRTGAPLGRGDMRALPFRGGVFAVAVNLFTSFGYFREDGEHRHVVREVFRTLSPRGRFVLDYLNADQVRREIRPVEQLDPGVMAVTVSRTISEDGRFVIKTIRLRDEGRSFQERVRLFTPGELAELLETSGFRVVERYGDYDASPLTPASPRAIFVGVRA